MPRYLAPTALLPGGWSDNVVLDLDAEGRIHSVTRGFAGPPGRVDARLPGAVVPGIVNAHCHSFQRALAGGAETRVGSQDSFWSWREQMYSFLSALSPDDVEAVASQLYVELLRQGYTRVVEFHYLHNDPRGRPYDNPVEMSYRLARAAERVGIGITLLPILYRTSDFGGARAGHGQRRFVLGVDRFLELVRQVQDWASPLLTPGFGFHSLRAVPPSDLSAVLRVLGDSPLPRHIHVAEQPREVEACRAWSGQRPVEWLLDHVPLDTRWGLVHCTHMTGKETTRLAARGAVAIVCPTTEANLGDGFFPLPAFQAARGRYAVGSDSNVSTSPVEELRWLEYGQRLQRGQRAVSAHDGVASVARRLLTDVWTSGASAAGIPAGPLAPGRRADFVVLDPDHPALTGRRGDGLLDAWIFSGNDSPIREVWVGGRRVVAEGIHPRAEAVASGFRETMRRLRSRV